MKTKYMLLAYTLFIFWVIWSVNNNHSIYIWQVVKTQPMGDKAVHFVLMGLFALLANLALNYRWMTFKPTSFPSLPALSLPLGTLLILVFSTLEEFSQMLLPNRIFDLFDLAMNYAGILTFSWLGWRYLHPLSLRG